MTKFYDLEGVGPVRLTKNSRYRNLKITVRPLFGVNVSIPLQTSFEEAEHFVRMKKEWIKRTVAKVKHFENKLTLFDENTSFSTRGHNLKIMTHQRSTLQIIIKKGMIYVFYPSWADVTDARIQSVIRKAVTEAWRIEAKSFLPGRVKELAGKFEFRYRNVMIKNAGTRWGSCSSVNNINLNVQLMRLPPHLTDYVILHELAHTVEKNHGKRFWALLEKITGNARGLDKQLKNYNLKVW